jgi:hypothetical protein
VILPAPARAALGSMKSQARSSISQSISSPTRISGGRPKNRVYQSSPAHGTKIIERPLGWPGFRRRS